MDGFTTRLFGPGTYFFVFFILLIPYDQFVILCNYSLCYVLFLHYIIVLFSLSGASHCAGYLFIIIIYSIVKLNVLLLLCISICSVACVSFFIHCVILFDLQ